MAEGDRAQDSLTKFRKELTCSICNELFKEPKTLSCLHTFCEKCLSDHIASRPVDPDPLTGDSQEKVRCLLCKNVQELKEADVKHMPTNQGYKNMVSHLAREERVRKACGSEPDRAVLICEACTVQDKAVAFCNTCNQLFCEVCSLQHKRSTMFKIHQVLMMGEISSSMNQIVPHQTWKCTKHYKESEKEGNSQEVYCDYYCETCDEIICTKCCITKPHGKHDKYVASEIVDEQGYKPRIKEHEREVEDVQEKFEVFINEMDKLKASLKAKKEKAKKEIDDKVNTIHAELERGKRSLLCKVDTIFERKNQRLEEQLEEMRQIDGELEDCRKFVNDTLTYGIPEEILFLKTKMIHRMKHLHDTYNPFPRIPRENDIITFDENTTLDLSGAIGSIFADPFPPAFTADNLEKMHFICDKQSSVVVTCRDIAGTPCPGKHTVKAELIPQPDGDAIVVEVRGQDEGKEEYVITLQPTAHGNHSLKISVVVNKKEVPINGSPFAITISASLVNEIQAENVEVPNMINPWGVAVGDNGEIVVSDVGCHKLVVISPDTYEVMRWIGSEGKRQGQFRLPHGLTFNNDGDIAVVDRDNHRVQIVSIEGVFKREFGKKGEGNGEFISATYIINDANGIIFVSDSKLHRIQYFTAAGDYVGKFGSWGPLDGPYALAFDGFGRIMITEKNGNSIQFFKKEQESDGNSIQFFKKEQESEKDCSSNKKEPAKSKQDSSSGGTRPTQCPVNFVYDSKTNFQLLIPLGIVYDKATNYIVVTEIEGNRISVFNRNGEYIRSFGTKGMNDNEFFSPMGVATLKDSRIVVCDIDKAKLMMFSIV